MTSFDITTLRAKTRNPRKISAADKAALAKSVAEFSKMLSLRPIVYDPVTMEVLGGNQRLVALKEAGYKEVPAAWVRSADELTEEEKRRFIVQDNAQAGEWDTELLLADYAVEELKDWGVDLPEFDVTEAAPEEESEPGPPPAEPESVLGDLYELNGHRLVCGDSTDADVVAKVLNGAKPDFVCADPPYGVEVVESSGVLKDAGYDAVLNDGDTDVAIDTYNLFSQLGAKTLVFWGANYYANHLPASPCWLSWDKRDSKPCDFADVELAWTNATTPARSFRHIWSGFWRDSEKGEKRSHPNQKPTALHEWTFETLNAGKHIADPFSGSGSVLLACERTERTAYAIELSPAYIDVAVKRWVKYMAENDRPFTVKRNGKDITTEAWLKQ